MSPTTRLCLAFAAILLAVRPVEVHAADPPERDGSPVENFMHSLSGIYVALHNAIESEDSESIRDLAERCSAQKAALDKIRGEIGRDTAASLDKCIARLEQSGLRTADAADRSDFRTAKTLLRRVRRDCVSCHMARRGAPVVDEIFIEKDAGVVAGRIHITRADGRDWPDASNVVVFLDGFAETGAPGLPEDRPAISQKERKFHPAVLPVVAGTTVDFPNDDNVFHNVFSLSKAKSFDLGLYAQGGTQSVLFDRPGLVKVFCNIHPNMVSTILVLNNSHHWTTSSAGHFALLDIPPGQHTIRAWYEFGDPVTQVITVRPDEITKVDLPLVKVRPLTDHMNKFGRPYEGGKY